MFELLKRYCKEEKVADNGRYISLAPTQHAEGSEVYFDAFDWALEQDGIHNIAVTGTYGSGKSSVVQSYFAQQGKKYKLLTISLANFNDNQGNALLPIERSQIESSILEQLFYHEKDSQIPDSHFHKIKKQSRGVLLLYAIATFVFLLLLLYLFNSDFVWSNLVGKEKDINEALWMNRIAIGLCSIGLFCFLYKAIRVLISISVRRLNFKSAEIEIESRGQKSVLNTHIDEIIYFFEATKTNVVVLEDLDRLGTKDIFVKLREINYLINNSNKVRQKVVFIYAIKDDVFTDKGRTKFFDFIIPIVPVINFSNSGEKFRANLQFVKQGIKDELIDDLSLFIDDMRLLYNIINEYKIYYKRMSSFNIDVNQLLAIIAYKNLYPQDFSDLGQNKGTLYDILKRKEDYIRQATAQNEKRLKMIQEEIEQLDINRALTAKELRIVYLDHILSKISEPVMGIALNGTRYAVATCAEREDLFNQIIEQSALTYYYTIPYNSSQRSQTLKFDWKKICQEVNEQYTFEQRIKMINGDRQSELLQEKRDLEIQTARIKSYSMAEMLNESLIDIEKDETLDDRQIELIDILMRHNYINENYWDYISVFHEGSLTLADKQFLVNVKRRISTPYNHHLQNIENIVKQINVYELDKYTVLNFDLMDYVLSETKEDDSKDKIYLSNLDEPNAPTIDFIVKYVERGKNIEYFLCEVASRWRGFWHYVSRNQSYLTDTVFIAMLKSANVDDIVQQLYNDSTNYLSNCSDFFLLPIERDKKYEIVRQLDCKFRRLAQDTSIDDCRFVYDGNYYLIEVEMMYALLSQLEGWNEQNFEKQNFDYIATSYPQAYKYISENKLDYILNVYLKLASPQIISSDSFGELIRVVSEVSDSDIQKQFLDKSVVKVEDISTIESTDLWEDLCERSMVVATWKNVECLWECERLEKNVVMQFLVNKENAECLVKQLNEEKEEIARATKILNLLVCDLNFINNDRIQLYILYSSWIEDVEMFLRSLGKPYSMILDKAHRAALPLSDTNRDLLRVLKQHNIIVNYAKVISSNYYRVYHHTHKRRKANAV